MKFIKKLKISADTALKVAIIFAILVGTVALAYRYVYYLPQKDKQRIEAEKQAKDERERKEAEEKNKEEADKTFNQTMLNACLRGAEVNYTSNWNTECKSQGMGDDCRLPSYNLDTIDKWRTDSKNECYKKYK